MESTEDLAAAVVFVRRLCVVLFGDRAAIVSGMLVCASARTLD